MGVIQDYIQRRWVPAVARWTRQAAVEAMVRLLTVYQANVRDGLTPGVSVDHFPTSDALLASIIARHVDKPWRDADLPQAQQLPVQLWITQAAAALDSAGFPTVPTLLDDTQRIDGDDAWRTAMVEANIPRPSVRLPVAGVMSDKNKTGVTLAGPSGRPVAMPETGRIVAIDRNDAKHGPISVVIDSPSGVWHYVGGLLRVETRTTDGTDQAAALAVGDELAAGAQVGLSGPNVHWEVWQSPDGGAGKLEPTAYLHGRLEADEIALAPVDLPTKPPKAGGPKPKPPKVPAIPTTPGGGGAPARGPELRDGVAPDGDAGGGVGLALAVAGGLALLLLLGKKRKRRNHA